MVKITAPVLLATAVLLSALPSAGATTVRKCRDVEVTLEHLPYSPFVEFCPPPN